MATYLIVGGVAGGAGVAARLRRRDENAQIIIFERGEHISFANCGLPYYVGGVIENRSSLFVMTPELFKRVLNVEARVNSEVVSVDRAQKTITVRNVKDDTTYTVKRTRNNLTIKLADVLVPVRTEIVAFVFVNSQIEFGSMLNHGFVKRRKQHVVGVVDFGKGDYQLAVILSGITVHQGSAVVRSGSVCTNHFFRK